MKSGASSNGPPPSQRDVEGETAAVLTVILSFFPEEFSSVSPNTPNGSGSRHALLDRSLNFQASLVADLIHARNFGDKDTWKRCIGVYCSLWVGNDPAAEFAEKTRLHFQAIDQVCRHSFTPEYRFTSLL